MNVIVVFKAVYYGMVWLLHALGSSLVVLGFRVISYKLDQYMLVLGSGHGSGTRHRLTVMGWDMRLVERDV
jgi:hypothetical protein